MEGTKGLSPLPDFTAASRSALTKAKAFRSSQVQFWQCQFCKKLSDKPSKTITANTSINQDLVTPRAGLEVQLGGSKMSRCFVDR